MVKVEIGNVKEYEWNRFMNRVEYLRDDIWVSTKIKDYRYNVVFRDGFRNASETTVFVGYEHNAKSATLGKQFSAVPKDLVIRFNPAKLNPQGELFEALRQLVASRGYKVILKEVDLAFDLPYEMSDVYVLSKTGKEKGLFRGTEYFGQRHTDGYLKKYDKAAQQGKQGVLTRIEVTLKEDLGSAELIMWDMMRPNVDKYYQVTVMRSLYNEKGGRDVNLKALALGLLHGYISEGELERRRKKQVKDYLKDNYSELNFDAVICREWSKQTQFVKSFLFPEYFLVEKEGKGEKVS
jgi:hypothetical protein